MSDDLKLADLLGEGPPNAPDPAFRYEVFARVAERARRRAAFTQAVNWIAAYAAIGLIFPVAQAAGLDFQAAQPVLLAAASLTVAAAVALLTILGPRAVLARSRAALRAPLLRA